MDSPSSSEIVEAVSPKFNGYDVASWSLSAETKKWVIEAQSEDLGLEIVEAVSPKVSMKKLVYPLKIDGYDVASWSLSAESKKWVIEAQSEDLGDAPHARYVILAPIRLSVTGYKHQGSNETKGISVVGQFMPKHLATMKEVKATIAEECKKSTYNYRLVDGFDITEDTLVKQLSFAVVHPCTLCNSVEHGDGGCYGEVKVDVREIYNALLNKEKYVEYQMYCKHDASLMGSVMFSKLTKPAAGWKGKLTGVGEKAKKAKGVLPYVSTGASLLAGGLGLILKQ